MLGVYGCDFLHGGSNRKAKKCCVHVFPWMYCFELLLSNLSKYGRSSYIAHCPNCSWKLFVGQSLKGKSEERKGKRGREGRRREREREREVVYIRT